MSERMVETACPVCGETLDTHERALGQDIPPKAGDLSVCLYCGNALVFEGEPLTLRAMNEGDLAKLQPHFRQTLARVMKAVRGVSAPEK